MGRPFQDRWIACEPASRLFKPAGIPAKLLRTTRIDLDELEAIRLVDGEGLDQHGAAVEMKISRATVGRILDRGRRKVAHALVHGEALTIEKGAAPVQFHAPRAGRRRGRCRQNDPRNSHRRKPRGRKEHPSS